MVGQVGTAHDRIAAFVAPYGNTPTTNSVADQELATFTRQESLRSAYSQGIILVEVAADQLIAFKKTVSEPVQTIAPWTSTRALLEASALACWLFEPNVDAPSRVQRSLAFRFEGLCQQRKWARAAGQAADLDNASGRIRHAERVALELGFTSEKQQQDKRPGVGISMPSVTDLIKNELDEEATYRLLSAMAHGHHWALIQLGFQKIDEAPATALGMPPGGGLGKPLEKALRPEFVAFLCVTALINFTKPVWRLALLFDWDTQKLADILDSVFDAVNISTGKRFWRSADSVSSG
jgi:hypothetical protein